MPLWGGGQSGHRPLLPPFTAYDTQLRPRGFTSMLPKETNGKWGQPRCGVAGDSPGAEPLNMTWCQRTLWHVTQERSCYNWILPTWKNKAGWLPPPRRGDKCLTSGVRMTDSMLSQKCTPVPAGTQSTLTSRFQIDQLEPWEKNGSC